MPVRILITAVFIIAPAVVAARALAADVPVNDLPKEESFIENWLVLGPFPNTRIEGVPLGQVTRAGFDIDFLAAVGGEDGAKLDVNTVIAGPDGEVGPPVGVTADKQGWVNIDALYEETDFKVAYAFCRIASDVEQEVYGHVGSNDGIKVWVNGEPVLSVFTERRDAGRDQNHFMTTLRAGVNEVLVKIDNKKEDWNFLLELYGRDFEQKRFLDRLDSLEIIPQGPAVETSATTLAFTVRFVPHTFLHSPGAKAVLKSSDGVTLSRSDIEIGREAAISVPPDAPTVMTLEASLDDFADRSLSTATTILRGDVGELKKDLLARVATLEGRGPVKMTESAWRRHVAVARYHAYLLGLDGATDEFTVSMLAKRQGTAVEVIPRLIEMVEAMEAGTDLFTDRRGAFRVAYISEADGSAQPYTLYVPEDYDPERAWPFHVNLHAWGGWCTMPEIFTWQRDYIDVRVDARGPGTGYLNLAEHDVLDVIADVRKHYNIDPARIYVRGSSMGGSGTWRMLTRYPGLFAAGVSYCGYPSGSRIENLSNVPLWIFHDREDWVVPIDGERWPVRLMRDRGYPARMSESEGYGHSAASAASAAGHNVPAWLLAQRRPEAPKNVTYTTLTPDRGRAYWLQITEFADPSRRAGFRARTTGANDIWLALENVETLAIDLPKVLFDADAALEVSVDGAICRREPPLGGRLFLHRRAGKWGLLDSDPVRDSPVRRYTVGSLSNLYSGEPLLIVYGTSGGDKLVEAMRALAGEMASHVAPWRKMDFATIPVKADSEVTDDDIRTRNLVLIGGPRQNSVTAGLADGLCAVERNGSVVLDGRLTWEMAGRGYSLYHYNPLAPDRLVFILSGEVESFYDLRGGLLDSAMSEELPLDFVLADAQPLRIVRRISFGKDWKPAERFYTASLLPEAFATEPGLRRERAAALRRVANADFAVCLKPEEPSSDLVFDVAHATWADFEAGVPDEAVVAADVTGEELLEMARALEKAEELSLSPELNATAVVATRTYRVVMLQHVLQDLARARRRNLDTVRFVTRDWIGDLRKHAAER
ncbi:MAG: carboxylesterase family protein [Planctomycetota bacterium]|jgi:predicted esterase